jgi:TRAP transporter 4TM/12TM fusion protein
LAGAIEAISSTGGQLMPPIMGVAAFVVAEMLQVDYLEIALAGLIPALAFYLAVFLFVDLAARKSGIGVLSPEQLDAHEDILPRLYLLLPPITLVSVLLLGYSATFSAVVATASCVLVCYFKRETWMNIREWLEAIELGTRQAAQVAVPIAAIGMIIAVSIQSNLALKFSSQLIEGSGGTLYGAMLLIIVGCIIMGMGLPTVAAYIIGAILFVPALLKLGIPEMSAHFFVMYYCVLSMVTPPVALASYTAAGIAGGGVMQTSYQAFRLSLVSFFIPFAFAFDPRLLVEGPIFWVLADCLSLMAGTGAWAVALVGYLNRPLNWVERGIFGALSLALIFSPTGTTSWAWALAGLGVIVLWVWFSMRLKGTREAAA